MEQVKEIVIIKEVQVVGVANLSNRHELINQDEPMSDVQDIKVQKRKASRLRHGEAFLQRYEDGVCQAASELRLSVVIPIGSNEDTCWLGLKESLLYLPKETEVIFVLAKGFERAHFDTIFTELSHLKFSVYTSEPGRAIQLNLGALKARAPWLWFLHADCRFSKVSAQKLFQFLRDNADPNLLLYFDLRFLSDGPLFMTVNSIGVWIRSHLLGLPFGDQGFCMRKEVFVKLGKFPTGCRYGEDHLFVWKANRCGVKVRSVGAFIYTSARKYKDKGWARTTCLHLYLTFKQAIPQLLMPLFSK
ncbi:MAG: glycosyl transferase family 2 [Bdellovibrionota bacterium]